jgi:hypothetical protein
MAEVEKMEKGSTYDVIIKYPESIGSVKLNDLKLVGEFLGPDVIRQTLVPEIDTIWFNIKNEAGVDDVVKDLNINDLTFYLFTDIYNNKRALAREWISEYTVSGNDYTFKVSNITVEQKMLLIKTLKNLKMTVTEL